MFTWDANWTYSVLFLRNYKEEEKNTHTPRQWGMNFFLME